MPPTSKELIKWQMKLQNRMACHRGDHLFPEYDNDGAYVTGISRRRIKKVWCPKCRRSWWQKLLRQKPLLHMHEPFAIDYIVMGIQKCTRDECKITREVFREESPNGMCGTIIGPWILLTSKREAWIKTLPFGDEDIRYIDNNRIGLYGSYPAKY